MSIKTNLNKSLAWLRKHSSDGPSTGLSDLKVLFNSGITQQITDDPFSEVPYITFKQKAGGKPIEAYLVDHEEFVRNYDPNSSGNRRSGSLKYSQLNLPSIGISSAKPIIEGRQPDYSKKEFVENNFDSAQSTFPQKNSFPNDRSSKYSQTSKPDRKSTVSRDASEYSDYLSHDTTDHFDFTDYSNRTNDFSDQERDYSDRSHDSSSSQRNIRNSSDYSNIVLPEPKKKESSPYSNLNLSKTRENTSERSSSSSNYTNLKIEKREKIDYSNLDLANAFSKPVSTFRSNDNHITISDSEDDHFYPISKITNNTNRENQYKNKSVSELKDILIARKDDLIKIQKKLIDILEDIVDNKGSRFDVEIKKSEMYEIEKEIMKLENSIRKFGSESNDFTDSYKYDDYTPNIYDYGDNDFDYNDNANSSNKYDSIQFDSNFKKQARPKQFDGNYPWSQEIDHLLLDVFGHNSFRSNQREIVNATLSRKDVLVIMPTGGGKSLTYQLPALYEFNKSKEMTVVISPLISLIEDQAYIMDNLGIKNGFLGSSQTDEGRLAVMQSISSVPPKIAVLLVTPEMITNSEYLNRSLGDIYRAGKLARFVIDEAHCVSNWGHDFRKDYTKLNLLKQNYRGVPIIAMTATATENVREDMINNLTLEVNDDTKFVSSFNRPNLKYEIRKKVSKSKCITDVGELIRSKYMNQSGIIYCLSQNECEEVAGQIADKYRIKADYYHAGLSTEDRSRIQRDWQLGRIDVICATIAFGMGINKPNVRYVVHFSLPKSLEGYYQESGRAGRDGEPSTCIQYYGYRDKSRIQFIMEKGWEEHNSPPEIRSMQTASLNSMASYCENKIECRRSLVLKYFGEDFKRSDCGPHFCDNCERTGGQKLVLKDVSQDAQDIVKIILYSKEKFSTGETKNNIVKIYRGSREKRVVERGYLKCPQHGNGAKYKPPQVERIITTLIDKQVIIEERQQTNIATGSHSYTTLSVSPRYQNSINSIKLEMKGIEAGPVIDYTSSGKRKRKDRKDKAPQTEKKKEKPSTTSGPARFNSAKKARRIPDNTRPDLSKFIHH